MDAKAGSAAEAEEASAARSDGFAGESLGALVPAAASPGRPAKLLRITRDDEHWNLLVVLGNEVDDLPASEMDRASVEARGAAGEGVFAPSLAEGVSRGSRGSG